MTDVEKTGADLVEEVETVEDTGVEDVEQEEWVDDPEIEKELLELDEGNIPLFNEERMSKLLDYLTRKGSYTGEFTATKNARLVESMISTITSVSDYPDDTIVSISYTAEELSKISRDLMRLIQATQYKRSQLSRKVIEEEYVRLDDVRLILTKEESKLLSFITSALSMTDQSPAAKATLNGEWTNSLEYNDRRIGTAIVSNHKDPIKRVRSKLNLMNEAAVHLVHSGLVVKLASAGSLDQALLNDNLVATKIQNSLTSFGTGMDMTSIYIDEILVEHIHRQLVDSNIGDMSRDVFEENLSILDLNVLYNAMATSLYPTGFKLHRQCMSMECGNIDEVLINPRRVVIYREDLLPKSAKQHLTRGFTKTDTATLRKYREELNPNTTKYFEIEEDMFIKFKVPTFAEYRRISKHWLEYLGDKSIDLIRGSTDEESRRRYIQQAMNKASAMMYSHWVDGVYTRDENGDYIPVMTRVQDPKGVNESVVETSDEQIDLFLADLSLNRETHTGLVKAIGEYIQDSIMALTVLAKSKCSKCGTPYMPEGDDVGDELISFNAGELFFTLLHRRTDAL